MCDCIKKISEAALRQVEAQLNKSNDEALLPLKETRQNDGILNPSGLKLKTNLIFQTDFKKKDGTRSKPRNSSMPLLFTYCPFCGIPYEGEACG